MPSRKRKRVSPPESPAVRLGRSLPPGQLDALDEEAIERHGKEEMAAIQALPAAMKDLGRELFVKHKYIHAIYTSTFKPGDLRYLNFQDSRVDDQDTDSFVFEISQDGTKAGFIKKDRPQPKAADFHNDIAVWLECFMLYATVYVSVHGDEHPEASRAMLKFARRFSRQAQRDTAEATITAALACLGCALRRPHVAESWNEHKYGFHLTKKPGTCNVDAGWQTEADEWEL